MAYDYDVEAYFQSGIHLARSIIARAIAEASGEECIVTNRRETKQSIQRDAVDWLTDAPATVPLPILRMPDDDGRNPTQDAPGDALSGGTEAPAPDSTAERRRVEGCIRNGGSEDDV